MLNLTDKRVVEGSVTQMLDWMDSFPKGNKMVGIWADNHLTADNKKMLAKSRSTKQPTAEVFPQGVYRQSYRTYALGVIYGNSVNTGRMRAAEEVATTLGIDPAAVEIEYFQPEQLWKGAGAKWSTYTVIHKPTGKLYFAGRPAQDNEGNVRVVDSEWRDAASGRVLRLEDVQDFLPSKGKSSTTIEVGGVTIEVEKPPYRAQGLDGLKGLVYSGWAFLINNREGAVVEPIAA